MKSFDRLRMHPWLTICLIAAVAFLSVGCKSSRSDSGATTNPLAAYNSSTGTVQVGPCQTTNAPGNVIGNGTTVTPGSLTSPVITIPDDGSSSINGHDNAPLLDNKHTGWQQSDCLTCHNDTTNNPDHNYNDDSLCYLCHGTNGLPGMSDTTPPVLSSVVVSPTEKSVTITWKSDEPCTSRLIIKTVEGDKMEFPVSTSYLTSHKGIVSGLQSATTYYYELVCVDKSGNKTSSSSFTSVLSFTTSAPAVVPITTPDETGTEEEEEGTEASDSIFKNVEFNVKDAGMVLLSFNTTTKPVKFYWRIYENRSTASKKGEGYRSDDFSSNETNKYTAIPMETGIASGTYYGRIQAVMSGTDDKWSATYKIKF